MNHHIGKPTICIGVNNGADQHLYRYMDSTFPLLSKSKMSSLYIAIFCDCTAWIAWVLVGNPNCWFSHAKAHVFYSLTFSSYNVINICYFSYRPTLFVCIEVYCPSQQFFSHVEMEQTLLGYLPVLQGVNLSCLRIQQGAPCGDRTGDP